MGDLLFNWSWLSKFRTCVNCCSVVGQQLWLCEVCAPVFEEQKNSGWISGYDLSVLSLYTWTPGLHRLNQRVAYSLKGIGPTDIYNAAAISMCSLRLSLNAPLVNPVFVPSPRSLRLHQPDHAENLCQALASVMDAEQIRALKRTNQSVHRRKSKAERERAAATRFELEGGKSMQILHEHRGTVVFVDDLITTGSTARAAWQVLGRPQGFEVWTLLNKPSGSC